MKRAKFYVRKNLKMSPNKIAAQCIHAALGLYKQDPQEHWKCIVLELSDKRFEEAKIANPSAYIVRDAGYTEVKPGSETVMAFWEDEKEEFANEEDVLRLIRDLALSKDYPSPDCYIPTEIVAYKQEGALPVGREAHMEKCANCRALIHVLNEEQAAFLREPNE